MRDSDMAGYQPAQTYEPDPEELAGFPDDVGVIGEFEDQEHEYVDEDRFTTVTIESVAVTRDGL